VFTSTRCDATRRFDNGVHKSSACEDKHCSLCNALTLRLIGLPSPVLCCEKRLREWLFLLGLSPLVLRSAAAHTQSIALLRHRHPLVRRVLGCHPIALCCSQPCDATRRDRAHSTHCERAPREQPPAHLCRRASIVARSLPSRHASRCTLLV
jgi:hypothetical protein